LRTCFQPKSAAYYSRIDDQVVEITRMLKAPAVEEALEEGR
jgi:hypothetical protein